MDDTHPKIRRLQIEGYRRMSASEKLYSVCSMYDFAVQLATADVKRQFPDADEWEVKMRVGSRWLDSDLMKRAYGWPPDEKK